MLSSAAARSAGSAVASTSGRVAPTLQVAAKQVPRATHASLPAGAAAWHKSHSTSVAAARGVGDAPFATTTTTSSSNSSRPVRTGDEYFVADKRPVILFDGVCNLCNGGVNFMLDWDKQGVYRMAALQSDAGRKLLVRSGRAPDDISSIVLVEEDSSYIRSDAVLRIATRLALPLPLVATLGWPVPRPFRDTLYDQVANNRYNLFGRTPSCRLSDPRFEERFLST